MADFQLSLDELREQIAQGKQFTLTESFLHNNNVLIGTERILTPKDLDRMDGKVYGPVRVKEFKSAGVDDSLINETLQGCIYILKKHRDYEGLLAEKRKRVEQVFTNILPSHDYATLRLSQLKKYSKRLFIHSVNTAIKSVLVDLAWQTRHNQGLINSIRFEEIIIAALLRNLGFLKTNQAVLAAKIGDLRQQQNELYLKVPRLSAAIIRNDAAKHNINETTARIIEESFEYLDGTGFPGSLRGEAIHPLAILISACSEFDLLLNGELSQSERSYMEINRRMMAMRGKFDPQTITIISEEFRYLRDSRG